MAAEGEIWSGDQVKEFIEAIQAEREGALERALEQADRERERASSVLRSEMGRQIDEGDQRLREHIQQQFQQISAALTSAEKLELERFARAEQANLANGELIRVLMQKYEIETAKFEATVAARFMQVNEFRGSLDDLSKQMATRRELESQVTSLQGKIEDLAGLVQELRSRLDTGPAGLDELRTRADLQAGRAAGTNASWGMIVGGVGLVATILGIVIVLANVLTSGGGTP